MAQFGESVLALPGDNGEGDLEDVLSYVIPALGILLALGGIGFALIRWRSGDGRPSKPAPAADGSRLDADMERYEL